MTRIWRITLLTMAAVGTFRASALAQPETDGKTAEEKKPQTATARRAELEENFRRMLSGSVLKGTWQMVQGEEGKPLTGRPLSEPRPEEYAISKVSKAGEDYWVIVARIKYADKNVNIPVTVQVKWAGDTPIITLDSMSLPGLGTYSARVMVYRDFYAGTWFGNCYGGILSGQIVKPEVAPTAGGDDAEKRPAPTTQPADD